EMLADGGFQTWPASRGPRPGPPAVSWDAMLSMGQEWGQLDNVATYGCVVEDRWGSDWVGTNAATCAALRPRLSCQLGNQHSPWLATLHPITSCDNWKTGCVQIGTKVPSRIGC